MLFDILLNGIPYWKSLELILHFLLNEIPYGKPQTGGEYGKSYFYRLGYIYSGAKIDIIRMSNGVKKLLLGVKIEQNKRYV